MTDDFQVNKEWIHLALVPDGNRRYAKKIGKPVWYGHYIGAKKIEKFIEWCIDNKKIKIISIFALSTENLSRPEEELRHLWDLYKRQFYRLKRSEKVHKNETKINILGSEDVWRSDVRQAAKDAMKLTAQYSRTILNILLNYGSRFEIVNTVKNIMKRRIKNSKKIDKLFDKFLWVSKPVDLIIRTGNQYRLSNFLLYQSAYAEIYFSKTLWPEFTKKEFDKIIRWYFEQKRKFGK